MLPGMDACASLRDALAGGRTRVEFISGFRHLLGAGRSCPRHAHRDVELVFHPTGSGTTRFADGSSAAFSAGAVVIYPAGLAHDQALDQPGTDLCLHVAFPGDGPAQPGILCADLRDPRLRRDFQDLTTVRRPDEPLAAASLDHRATALLCALAAQPAVGDDHAALASELIARDHAVIGSIGDVAQAVGISADRLRHLFTARYGFGPAQWLANVRCDRACDLLARSDMPLAGIAAACGFRSVRHLSEAFRRAQGEPPMRWRRRHRPPGPFEDRAPL